ncbi:putative HTH-type transcriptional regulator YttP [Halioglobus japonicus]|nr:putative HTH-type transcriptional regulator YttP [Halioglobus japonicus]
MIATPIDNEAPDDRSTKDRILDAALVVFAEQGFEGASIRKIVTSAGANVAAGHYYFGSKYALYSAVTMRYLEQLNQTRYEALDRLVADADGEIISLKSLIRAFIEPHIRFSATRYGSAYAKLIARFLVEQHSLSAEIFEKGVYPMRRRFAPHLAALFPGANEQQLDLCFQFIALNMSGAASQNANWDDDPLQLEADIEAATVFLTGGISALASLFVSTQTR